MKTLKKSLVLVLAFMMAVSVFAFGAGAAYTDEEAITPEYKEAIDVLTGLGVIAGIGDGTLAPKANIERAQLAKILYEAYTGKAYTTAASYAGMGTFKDVASDAWYAGVVNYAAYKGWIKGYGDGNFGPMDNVIGYDALTMILRMMGYGAFDELTGTNYRANAIELATTKLNALDNTDKNSVDYSKVATREEVFEYLYGAMGNVPVIKANADDLTYTPDGAKTLLEKKGFKGTPTYTYEIVTAVPANDTACYVAATATIDEVLKVAFKAGTPVVSAIEFGPEYIGKVVKVLSDSGDSNKVYSMQIISEEFTVEKDVTVDGTKVKYSDYAEGLVNDAAVAKLDNGDATMTAVSSNGVLEDGTYYYVNYDAMSEDGVTNNTTLTLTDGQAKVATFVVPEVKVEFEVLTIADTTSDNAVVNIDGVDKTAKDLENLYKTESGIDYASLKNGKYAVAAYTFGDFTTKEILEVVELDANISAVKKNSDGTTTLTANGASYTVFDGKGYAVTKTDISSEEVVSPAVNTGKGYELIKFNGQYIVTDGDLALITSSTDAAKFTGFAKVLKVEAKATAASGLEGGAPTVDYAQVKVMLNDGTTAVYDLKTTVEKASDGTYKVKVYPNANSTVSDANAIAVGSTVTTINGIDVDSVYAYSLEGNTINLYTASEINTADVKYEFVDYTASDLDTKAYQPTISVTAFTASRTLNVTKAPFVAKEASATDYTVVNGTETGATFTDGTFVVVVKKAVGKTAADDKYTAEVIFAGEYTPASTATNDIVYVNAAEKEAVYDADAKTTTYYYTAYTADGKTVVVKGADATASGFYKLKSDNGIAGKTGNTAPLDDTSAIKGTATAVTFEDGLVNAGGTYIAVADDVVIVNVGTNEYDAENGNTIVYLADETSGAITTMFIVG